jgi:ABC-2 type transport system permease protein
MKFFTLLEREIKSFFYSPIGYVVLCLLLFLLGFTFYIAVMLLSRGPTDRTIIWAFFNNLLFWITYVLIFPLITMRSFSEEFKMGTIESLMTAPVKDWQVVMAKWLGCLFFYCIIFLPTTVYFWAFNLATKAQNGHMQGAYIGSYLLLLLMGMFFTSIGCFASVLTRNQIVAAITSLVIILVLVFSGMLQYVMLNVSGDLRDLFGYFAATDHMDSFSQGIIDSRPIVWYLTMTTLMLVLTYQVFQSRKWKL